MIGSRELAITGLTYELLASRPGKFSMNYPVYFLKDLIRTLHTKVKKKKGLGHCIPTKGALVTIILTYCGVLFYIIIIHS